MTVAQTSLVAFEFVREDLSDRQYHVLSALEQWKDYSNTEIARLTGLPINCVTPRVFELREFGLLISAGVRACKVTGKIVQTWRRA